jgi:hypothetical protein
LATLGFKLGRDATAYPRKDGNTTCETDGTFTYRFTNPDGLSWTSGLRASADNAAAHLSSYEDSFNSPLATVTRNDSSGTWELYFSDSFEGWGQTNCSARRIYFSEEAYNVYLSDPNRFYWAMMHEMGHALRMDHTGHADSLYDTGGDPWTPILGNAGLAWTEGQPGLAQDDLAQLTRRLDGVSEGPEYNYNQGWENTMAHSWLNIGSGSLSRDVDFPLRGYYVGKYHNESINNNFKTMTSLLNLSCDVSGDGVWINGVLNFRSFAANRTGPIIAEVHRERFAYPYGYSQGQSCDGTEDMNLENGTKSVMSSWTNVGGYKLGDNQVIPTSWTTAVVPGSATTAIAVRNYDTLLRISSVSHDAGGAVRPVYYDNVEIQVNGVGE